MEQTAPIHTCRPGGRRPEQQGDRGGPHWRHGRLYLDLPTRPAPAPPMAPLLTRGLTDLGGILLKPIGGVRAVMCATDSDAARGERGEAGIQVSLAFASAMAAGVGACGFCADRSRRRSPAATVPGNDLKVPDAALVDAARRGSELPGLRGHGTPPGPRQVRAPPRRGVCRAMALRAAIARTTCTRNVIQPTFDVGCTKLKGDWVTTWRLPARRRALP